MKLLLTVLLCWFAFQVCGQSAYSYSFSGAIDSSFVGQIEAEAMKLDGVVAAKAKYKVEKRMGEVLIYTQEDDQQKEPYVFSPGELKAVFIRNNLQPGELIQLKTSK